MSSNGPKSFFSDCLYSAYSFFLKTGTQWLSKMATDAANEYGNKYLSPKAERIARHEEEDTTQRDHEPTMINFGRKEALPSVSLAEMGEQISQSYTTEVKKLLKEGSGIERAERIVEHKKDITQKALDIVIGPETLTQNHVIMFERQRNLPRNLSSTCQIFLGKQDLGIFNPDKKAAVAAMRESVEKMTIAGRLKELTVIVLVAAVNMVLEGKALDKKREDEKASVRLR